MIHPSTTQPQGNKMTNATQTNSNVSMYGVADMAAYIQSIKQSTTYKFTGAHMIVAGLMSDAQEEIAHGEEERARKTLNRAKAVLFEIMDGNLVGTVERV
jgi:hypothetical protein